MPTRLFETEVLEKSPFGMRTFTGKRKKCFINLDAIDSITSYGVSEETYEGGECTLIWLRGGDYFYIPMTLDLFIESLRNS